MSSPLLTLAEVSERLNVSASQTYALVRSGELRALKIGGRGQWRVEATELDDYLARCYHRVEDEKGERSQRRDQAAAEHVDLLA